MTSDEIPQEETLAYVTPYALNLNSGLIGKALAVPWKRLVAITLDGLVIAVLSSLPFYVAIAVFGYAFLKRHSKRDAGSQWIPQHIRRRVWLATRSMLGILVILVLLLSAVGAWLVFTGTDLKKLEPDLDVKGVVITPEETKVGNWAIAALVKTLDNKIQEANCETPECWRKVLAPLPAALPDLVAEKKGHAIINAYVDDVDLSAEERQAMQAELIAIYGKPEASSEEAEVYLPPGEEPQKHYSVIAWAKGVLADLGIGFGWAAVYFTVLTSGFNGRTPGKYLMRLQVLKLDNSKLTFWDSFGRYGGYAAGISTGLLGFMQILWDPNRQAIQDKIAATIVVDLSKPNWAQARRDKPAGEK